MSEEFRMSEIHKKVLSDNRVYLLRELYPSEVFWGALLQTKIFPDHVLDEIKACKTKREQISTLLDRLPSRGPTAFNSFCDALLEHDDIYIYQYLKKQEAAVTCTDVLKPGFETNFGKDVNLNILQILQQSSETAQRCYDRKTEINRQGHSEDLKLKEDEIRNNRAEIEQLNLHLKQQTKYFRSFCKMVENAAKEIQEDFISRSYIRREKKNLEYIQDQIKGEEEMVKTYKFCDYMLIIVEFMERQAGPDYVISNHRLATPKISLNSDSGSLQEQLRMINTYLVQVREDLPDSDVCVSRQEVRMELENIVWKLHEISENLCLDMDISLSSQEKKRRLNSAIRSQSRDLQEISRLELEKQETKSHVSELNRQYQNIKTKSPNRQTTLQEVKMKIEQKHRNEKKIEVEIEKLKNSVYQQGSNLMSMMSDIDNDDNSLSDTCNSFEVSPNHQDTEPKQNFLQGASTQDKKNMPDTASIIHSEASTQTNNTYTSFEHCSRVINMELSQSSTSENANIKHNNQETAKSCDTKQAKSKYQACEKKTKAHAQEMQRYNTNCDMGRNFKVSPIQEINNVSIVKTKVTNKTHNSPVVSSVAATVVDLSQLSAMKSLDKNQIDLETGNSGNAENPNHKYDTPPDIKTTSYVQEKDMGGCEPEQKQETLELDAKQLTTWVGDTSSMQKPSTEILIPNINIDFNATRTLKTTKIRESGNLGNRQEKNTNQSYQKRIEQKSFDMPRKHRALYQRKCSNSIGVSSSFKMSYTSQTPKQAGIERSGFRTARLKEVSFDGSSLSNVKINKSK